MAWVPVNRSVFTHRKTMKLADLLDIPEVYAVAHLAALWTWAMDNAPTGIIPEGTSARMIARASEFPGNAQSFLEALLESQYLAESEGGYELPNWMEYGGKLLVQQEKDAARKRAGRSVEGKQTSESTQDVSDGCPTDIPVTADVEKKRKEKNIFPLTPTEQEAQTTTTNGRVFSETDTLPVHITNFLAESCPDWWEPHLRLALAGRIFTGTMALTSYSMEVLRGWKKGKNTPQSPLPPLWVQPDKPIPSLSELRARKAAALSAQAGGSSAPQ